MARAATTSDVFNAIAEPRRREIVDLLAVGAERDVTELVLKLGLPPIGQHQRSSGASRQTTCRA
jgi:DNA-binding transcriptional ArsR family regulator